MTEKKRSIFVEAPLVAALSLLGMALLYASQAGAVYLRDGAVGNSPLTYDNPKDGMCVVGIRNNAGTAEFLIDKNITNARDCAAYTTNLTTMTTQPNCAPAAVGALLGPGTSGWRHNWSSGFCKSGANGISRVDLDNTAAMCTAKGGVLTGSACVAYGWLYRGATSGTVPAIPNGPDPAAPFNASNYEVWTGVTYASGHGFCYREMDFTAAANINNSCTAAALPYACCTGVDTGTCGNADCTAAGLPYTCCTGVGTGTCGNYTKPLSTTWPDPGNDEACPMFHPNNATGRSRTGTTWSDFYWNWNTSTGMVPPTGGTKCRNAYGVKGKFMSAATSSVMGVAWDATTKYDLTGITNQAECVAKGLSWEPALKTTGPVDATARGVLSGTACGASEDCYYAVDITTAAKDGGGYYVSRQCLKCHSDQSRGMAEYDKPGFIETPHKHAGDSADPVIAAIGDPWGTKGVQCSVCHGSTNPEKTDLINKDDSGAFIRTSAHENFTAGAGVTQVCYHCHSDATLGVSANTTPAAVIPVSGGDFAQNGQHLAPIVNQFLNSPHGEYSGDNTGGDLRDEVNYASTFIGYNCKAGTSSPPIPSSSSPTVAWDATSCAAAVPPHTWTGSACVYNATSCAAVGTWDAATSLCYGPGLGGSLSTVYQSGAAGKIHFLDSTTNADCTNAATGSPSGAAGYWVKEGEDSHTAQGSCMTCHDVHWDIDSAIPGAEPFRRECTTCHENSGTSASGAPQIDLTKINHPANPGTPMDTTKYHNACQVCHMAVEAGTQSPLHLWRINTEVSYVTMSGTQVPLTAGGKAWVDLDLACGQCHGGTAGSGATKNDAPYFTKAQLALVANGIHDPSTLQPEVYPVTFSYTASGLTVDVAAAVDCGFACPPFTYEWTCGTDGTFAGPGATGTCTYTSVGSKSISLTVRSTTQEDDPAPGGDNDGVCEAGEMCVAVGSATRSLRVYAPDPPPTAGVTCSLDANTWVLTATDTSTDDDGDVDVTADDVLRMVAVNWGDGATWSSDNVAPFGPFTHTYRKAGTYTVTLKAIDTSLQAATATCSVSPAYFTISGSVYKSDGTTGLGSAAVTLTNTTTGASKTKYTAANGLYSAPGLKPDTYRITVRRRGYAFDVPARPDVIVGPSKTGMNINANP